MSSDSGYNPDMGTQELPTDGGPHWTAELEIPWCAADSSIDNLFFVDEQTATERLRTHEGYPDLLCTMFANQERFITLLGGWDDGVVPGDLNSRATQAKIREHAGYMIEETMEAINHLKNKPWKRTDTEVDHGAFYEEIADAFHFWINLLLVAGIRPEDLFRHYFAKAVTNVERQRTGY